jgi:hypothetical protein
MINTTKNFDWQESQNEDYLHLIRARLLQPKMKWVDQFTSIINSKAKFIKDSTNSINQSFLCNDFGCNVGHFFRGVADINMPINYRGYDISEIYLKIARNEFGFEYFENLDIASESIDKLPRDSDISVISATLEHIENYHTALKNIFSTTRRLVVMRTFIGDLQLKDYCRTHGASRDYLIRQFTLDDLVSLPVNNGWLYEAHEDIATQGIQKMVCNGKTIPRTQKILVFSRGVK